MHFLTFCFQFELRDNTTGHVQFIKHQQYIHRKTLFWMMYVWRSLNRKEVFNLTYWNNFHWLAVTTAVIKKHLLPLKSKVLLVLALVLSSAVAETAAPESNCLAPTTSWCITCHYLLLLQPHIKNLSRSAEKKKGLSRRNHSCSIEAMLEVSVLRQYRQIPTVRWPRRA